MSKAIKSLLAVFTMLCAIVLVIFSVELFIINRETEENGEPGSTISGGSSTEAGNENGDQGVPDPGPSEEPGSSGDADPGGDQTQQNGQHLPPTGRRHELPMLLDEMMLILYVDDELFEFVEEDYDWWFHYSGDGDASLEISFDYITPPGGINMLVNHFLDPYLDGGESFVGGEGPIRNSSVRGFFVYGDKNGETYEAWIHSLTGSLTEGLAVVFIINYQNETQRIALHRILDSLEMSLE
jgi:hypothetical protein